MTFDYKKEYRDWYLPKAAPAVIDIPSISFIALAGTGSPSEENGLYTKALGVLYSLSYTIKMSKMGSWQPEGYFDYVVPPLEGFWWIDHNLFDGTKLLDKTALSWVSLIRQPDFVNTEVFNWALSQVEQKKPTLDLSGAHFVRFSEGLCAQVMHRGSYDNEPASIKRLQSYIQEAGLKEDIAANPTSQDVITSLQAKGGVAPLRLHHEIYLGDPRRTKPENLKTVIRHPVVRA